MTDQNGFNEEPQNPPQPPHQPLYPTQEQTPDPGQASMQQGYDPVQPAPSKKTNTLAIVSLITAFFVSILGIILGHIALSQIKKTGESGRGLALAGTILGYVFTFFWIIVLIILLTAGSLFGAIFNSAVTDDSFTFETDDNNSSQIEDGFGEGDSIFNDDPESDFFADDDFFEEGTFETEVIEDEVVEDGVTDDGVADDGVGDDKATEDGTLNFDDLDQVSASPWLGTELEEFCNTMFVDVGLYEASSTEFLIALSQSSPDKETKEFYDEAAKTIAQVEVSTDIESIKKMRALVEQLEQDAVRCYME